MAISEPGTDNYFLVCRDISGSDSQWYGIVYFKRQITLSRKIEAQGFELGESEERFRRLFDTSLDAILITAPDGEVFAANPSACRIFGRTEDEIRKMVRYGTSNLADPRLSAALEERLRTGYFFGELTFVRKNGEIFPGEISYCII